ncbi:LuxR family transcriptional regulator [Amycolatopsis antarctica]|uniref:LuxR family transcriptional regulator n=1 Tax=Amycolatopsis antarctica TaxID=1854586 RepID=A0A263D180_9PSEU|nr:LuxR family transcriptional regulator [Amycolatopsis antarctica]
MVIVDGHPAVRAGVRQWLRSARPSIEVLASGGEAGTAWSAPGRDADVVVLGADHGDVASLPAALRRLADAGRRVVVYSALDDARQAARSVELGALCHLGKVDGEERLVAAVRAASTGRAYRGSAVPDGRPALSERESEVLVEWFRSESKELVACRLGISPSTVNSYLERARVKYARDGREAATKSALLARAIQDGLVGLDEL